MLDNLRDQPSSSGPFFEEAGGEAEIPDFLKEDAPPPPEPRRKRSSSSVSSGPRFLGMTAQQRFIIVAMLVVLTCLLGVVFLLVSGSLYIG